jgi:hypothetical protein
MASPVASAARLSAGLLTPGSTPRRRHSAQRASNRKRPPTEAASAHCNANCYFSPRLVQYHACSVSR